MMPAAARHRQQRGAASLLMALVLMISVTIVTLAVARTQVSEQKIVANQNWNTRLSLAAEAGMVRGIDHLTRSLQDMTWDRVPDQATRIHRLELNSADPAVNTEVSFSHPQRSNSFLSVQATSRREDRSGLQANVVQYVRPLSILTPLAETAAPLVVNGCLRSLPFKLHIRPRDADSDRAGDAVWLNRDIACPVPLPADLHNGTVRRIDMGGDLWQRIFSVTREEFRTRAAQERGLPASERRYWSAQSGDLRSGYWNRSLGSAETPVALYFGTDPGCPEFSPGVRIHGLVFIDAGCHHAVASHNLAVFGSLVINGDLDVHHADMQLNHIQLADRSRTRLQFPVLRTVPVPGSWRDF